ncbi:hypothetical protein BBJ28_00024745 [Nothophytophthora sp. Chile5]|nr:hypothetical protein BBJ28_00024745 [Nothophytophthora sp. Chile5]
MTPATTGKRRRPASASLSPPPPPSRPTRAMGSDEARWKKRRLESSGPSERSAELERKAMEKEEKTLRIHVPGGDAMKLKEQERKSKVSGKRRRRSEELLGDGEQEEAESKQKKKRRVSGDGSSTSPPPDLPTSPPANLSERRARPSTVSSGSSVSEEKAIEEEEKPQFPPPPIEIPRRQDEEDDEVPKENRADELREVCANLEETGRTDTDEQVRQHKLLRSVQVTPPPSARMLDRKNPPPPPPRPKTRYRRNYRGVVYARSYPRLALSPLVDSSPPTSPRMFRSLENEFAFAMQETPEIRPQVRPAPRMARGARRSTRAGASRARRSLDTPTSTMVLRSRQLNPSHSSDGVKPENQREREQREAHRRQ